MLVCDEGSCEDRVRRCSLILFHQCVSQPEKWVGKHTLFLWGCVALSKVHFIYKSKSGHSISPQHRHAVLTHTHTNTHDCTTARPRSLADSQRNTPCPSPPPLSLTHPHVCPLSVFEQYMRCPETGLHAQLMSLLSRWLTLANSHSQALPKFHSPPPPNLLCWAHSWASGKNSAASTMCSRLRWESRPGKIWFYKEKGLQLSYCKTHCITEVWDFSEWR